MKPACVLILRLYEKVVNVGDQQDVEDLLEEPDNHHYFLGEDPCAWPKSEPDAKELINGPPPPKPCVLDFPLIKLIGEVSVAAVK